MIAFFHAAEKWIAAALTNIKCEFITNELCGLFIIIVVFWIEDVRILVNFFFNNELWYQCFDLTVKCSINLVIKEFMFNHSATTRIFTNR